MFFQHLRKMTVLYGQNWNKGNKMALHDPLTEAKRKFKRKKFGKRGRGKIEKTMHEFKARRLHSGSKHGPLVTGRSQAVAIALSKARKAEK